MPQFICTNQINSFLIYFERCLFKFLLQKRNNQVCKVSIYLIALKIAFPSAREPPFGKWLRWPCDSSWISVSIKNHPIMLIGLIFSNKATVGKYRNYFIINIRIYLAVNKVRIPFEDWPTLRSNISIIYREDLAGPISSYSHGHPQHNKSTFITK